MLRDWLVEARYCMVTSVPVVEEYLGGVKMRSFSRQRPVIKQYSVRQWLLLCMECGILGSGFSIWRLKSENGRRQSSVQYPIYCNREWRLSALRYNPVDRNLLESSSKITKMAEIYFDCCWAMKVIDGICYDDLTVFMSIVWIYQQIFWKSF